MKKILFLLFIATSYGYGQGVSSSDFAAKRIITEKIELNGHEPKGIFIFESILEGIKIYNKDSNQKYKLRKCGEKDCKIIHLEEYSFAATNTYFVNNNKLIQLAN